MLFGQWCEIHTNNRYNLKNTIVTNIPPIIKKKNSNQKAISLEITGGGILIDNIGMNQAGLFLNLCDPKSKGYFNIRTGIQKFNLFDLNNKSILRIPIQLEVRLNNNILVPRLAVGLNYYPTFHTIAPNVMTGINLRISRSMSMTFTYDIDYIFNDWADSYDLQSLSAGFIIGLK